MHGPNYDADQSHVVVTREGEHVATLHPQKRVYLVQRIPMTEAGIEVDWNRDLFVAMGDDLGAGAWSMRIQYKPMVRFIWLGCLVMALGGIVAVSDRRYRPRRETVDEKVRAGSPATAREPRQDHVEVHRSVRAVPAARGIPVRRPAARPVVRTVAVDRQAGAGVHAAEPAGR